MNARNTAVRIIPCLQLSGGALVKTVRFGRRTYIGDPINTLRIFNELEVDELVIVDIDATSKMKGINYALLEEISSECFMPLTYGGGINDVEQIGSILKLGYEKIIINTALSVNQQILRDAVAQFGSQAIIAAIDCKRSMFGKYRCYANSGSLKLSEDLIDWVKRLEAGGVGEILLTNIDREGTWKGPDLELINSVCDCVEVPVIAQGGFATVPQIVSAINQTSVSAIALGNMVVFQKEGSGILISYPTLERSGLRG